MPDIIDSLKPSLCHLHGVSQIQVIETHISWILLTGKIVYKVKKPVDLGFVDFTTLEKRKFYCFEELRLNKRLAPELYIDVAAITQDASGLTINGKGPTIDYAVRLHQFDHDKQLDVLIDQQNLTAGGLLAAGGLDNTVRLFDTQTGEQLRTLQGQPGAVYSMAFSPDGHTLATGTEDLMVRLWDVDTGRLAHEMEGHTDWVNGAEVARLAGNEEFWGIE